MATSFTAARYDMRGQRKTGLYQPQTIADALAALSDLGSHGAVIAGGTWTMRAPLRCEPMAQAYVATARIPELHRIEVTPNHVRIGSAATHAQLAGALQAAPDLAGLRSAAADSANPAVRRAATVGGNICTTSFSAADLVPALLCLDAEVEFETLQGRQHVSLEAFLAIRERLPAYLLICVLISRRPAISAHVRLPLRKAGDYPVAIVSASMEQESDGMIRNAAIAVGAVEVTARRWTSLDEVVSGLPLDPPLLQEHASRLACEFIGREGPETLGWYRVQVLPALVRRAFENFQKL